MDKVTLSKSQARRIILHAAGLSRRSQFGRGKEAVFRLIAHLGFVQVDTNFVVERAHHHAIACRVPGYQPEWLDELQSEGRIFEFWTYASGYIPIEHFRFSLPVKASFMARRQTPTTAEINLMNKVLDRIGREGPLMARDFENDRVAKSKGWWDWRPSKIALEWLHLGGKLMTTRRPDFQKVYDLTGNVLPPGINQEMPTPDEFARHIIVSSLKALGVASAKDVALRGRYVKNRIKEELAKMVGSGEVVATHVKKVSGPLYMLPEYRKSKIAIHGDAFILSPFDILNVYRQRLKTFFDFDYMVECFVPKPKRKYGYFSLPILIGEVFVARMDSKADRKQRKLLIYNLHFEKVKLTRVAITKLAGVLADFVKLNHCIDAEVERTNNKTVAKTIMLKVKKLCIDS